MSSSQPKSVLSESSVSKRITFSPTGCETQNLHEEARGQGNKKKIRNKPGSAEERLYHWKPSWRTAGSGFESFPQCSQRKDATGLGTSELCIASSHLLTQFGKAWLSNRCHEFTCALVTTWIRALLPIATDGKYQEVIDVDNGFSVL